MRAEREPTTTISRLRVALGTLIGVRECLADALEFAERGIETIRKVIQDESIAEAERNRPGARPESEDAWSKIRAEIITMVCNWRRSGRKWVWIADELNRRGYRNMRGKPWTSAILSVFCHRNIKSLSVFGRRDSENPSDVEKSEK